MCFVWYWWHTGEWQDKASHFKLLEEVFSGLGKHGFWVSLYTRTHICFSLFYVQKHFYPEWLARPLKVNKPGWNVLRDARRVWITHTHIHSQWECKKGRLQVFECHWKCLKQVAFRLNMYHISSIRCPDSYSFQRLFYPALIRGRRLFIIINQSSTFTQLTPMPIADGE